VAEINRATQDGNTGNCRINEPYGRCLLMDSSTKGIHIQTAAFNDAFQGADGNVCCHALPRSLAGHFRDAISGDCPIGKPSRKPCLRKTLTTSFALQTGYRRLTAPRARSFLHLGQFDRRGSNQSASASWLSNGFRFGVARGGAAGQFGEHCRPAFSFWIKFNQQPEFHYQNHNRGAPSKQPTGGK